MSNNTFMDRIRSFFGLRSEPPKNDFRNPIWGSDDDDDGDELFTRQQVDINTDLIDLQREFVKSMQEMFMNFGNMFDDMKLFFGNGDLDSIRSITDFPTSDDKSETFDSNRIRDQYLKPGYEESSNNSKQDVDLDGKISSQDISGLLNQKENSKLVPPYSGIIPGKNSCTTVITTMIKRPDGVIETRRTVKNGDQVIEETTTSLQVDGIPLPFNSPFNIDFSYDALTPLFFSKKLLLNQFHNILRS